MRVEFQALASVRICMCMRAQVGVRGVYCVCACACVRACVRVCVYVSVCVRGFMGGEERWRVNV